MSSKFGRVAEVLCGGRTFSSDDFKIEFRVDFDDDAKSNTSEITIYNLSESTISKLKKKQKITLNAGYKNDRGVIMSGYITKVLTKRDGTDHPTTIHIIDSEPLDSDAQDKTANKSYKKGIKSSYVLRDLAKLLGLQVAVLELPNDRAFSRGYYVNGSIFDAIRAVARDCGADYYINRGKLYIRPKKSKNPVSGSGGSFTLNSESGLIGTPEPFEEEKTEDKKGRIGYKAKCLLQHRINTQSTIQLDSIYIKGRYQVTKGSHYWEGDKFYTEVEVE